MHNKGNIATHLCTYFFMEYILMMDMILWTYSKNQLFDTMVTRNYLQYLMTECIKDDKVQTKKKTCLIFLH